MEKAGSKIEIEKEKVENLGKVLKRYEGLFAEARPDVVTLDVVKAYRFEKPLTSIEIYDRKAESVRQFMKALEEYFFVSPTTDSISDDIGSQFEGLVFVSRFKTLVEVAVEYEGLSDAVGDLAGVLYGYPLKSIASYCSKERLKACGLIK